jgi:hypothetical protein
MSRKDFKEFLQSFGMYINQYGVIFYNTLNGIVISYSFANEPGFVAVGDLKKAGIDYIRMKEFDRNEFMKYYQSGNYRTF